MALVMVACVLCRREIREQTPEDVSAAADGWGALCEDCGDADKIDAMIAALPVIDGQPTMTIDVTPQMLADYDRERKEKA